MSYIWVYDNILKYSTPNQTNSKYASYIGYSKNSNTDASNGGKYTTIQKYNSFVEVNNYIKQQINIFESTFGTTTNTNSIIGEVTISNYNKTMKTRYYDLLIMQYSFHDIMNQLLNKYYGNNYNNLLQTTNNYFNYRDIITNGLDEINKNDKSINYNTNLLLDSTLYSTVLWTILAICLLYYVFIKI